VPVIYAFVCHALLTAKQVLVVLCYVHGDVSAGGYESVLLSTLNASFVISVFAKREVQ
jgi:hypothetical protein